ncbi:MAG: TRAP transporter substrate-binding protein DctP [Myxococcota bacterium]
MKRLQTLATVLTLSFASTAFAVTPVDECNKKIKADPKTVQVELKMVTLAPAGSQWAKEFSGWSDDVLSQSDCTIMLKWYWNGGGGGDELRMVADLRQGQKHGAAMTSIGLSEIYKEILLFQLPGLYDNWPALDAAREKEKKFFEEEFAKKGFVIVGWGDVGAAKMLSVGAPIKTPADLKDMNGYHLPGDTISPMLFSKVGVKGKPMSIGEVGSHLGKDVNLLNMAPYAAEQLQLASKVTHMTAMTTAFVTGALVMTKAKLDSLTDAQRKIILDTGRAHGESLTKTIRNQDADAFSRMKKSKQTYTPTEDEVKLWKQTFETTRMSLRGAPFNPEVFDRIAGPKK